MFLFNKALVAVFLLSSMLPGCQKMIPRDTTSLLIPRLQRSEICGLAGLGTTEAAFPDLVLTLRRRSSKGLNPRMATITGIFQILWVDHGLLILS